MISPRIRKRPKIISGYTKTGHPVSPHIPFTKPALAAFLVNFLIVILTLVLKAKLPPEIPLFYGAAEGHEQIATSILLVVPAIISLLFITVNLFLSYFLEDEFLKKALMLTAISTSLLAATTTIKIFLLVGSI